MGKCGPLSEFTVVRVLPNRRSEVVGEAAEKTAAGEPDLAEVLLVGSEDVPCAVPLRQDHVRGVGDPESREVGGRRP
jgi:hypothetical protein